MSSLGYLTVLTSASTIARQFIKKVRDTTFTSDDALNMLSRQYTIDYGASSPGGAGGRPLEDGDSLRLLFHLDYISIVGRPLCTLSQPQVGVRYGEAMFDNFDFTFRYWAAPYGAKHVSGINFDLTGRTFRIAEACTREAWFIVMHPLRANAGGDNGAQTPREAKTAMSSARAEELADYIVDLFSKGELIGSGVERRWRLGGTDTQKLHVITWTAFQESFVKGWAAWISKFRDSSFWRKHEPAFHAYDYGADVPILVGPQLGDMPPSEVDPPSEPPSQGPSRSASHSNGDQEASRQADVTEDEVQQVPDLESDVRENLANQRNGDDQGDQQPASPESIEDLGVSDDDLHAGLDDLEDPEDLENHLHEDSDSNEDEEDGEDEEDEDTVDQHRQAYLRLLERCLGLKSLIEGLKSRYVLENISAISYALAVCMNCKVEGNDEDARPGANVRVLLADRNKMAHEFARSRDYTFHPQAFHPALGNFTSPGPPAFLEPLTTALQARASQLNEGADVVSFGYFQCYTNMKRSFRHSPNDLLATQGSHTAALTVSRADVLPFTNARSRRDTLLSAVRGGTATKPFAREGQQLKDALKGGQVAYRMEQVVHVQVSEMTPRTRTFEDVVRPAFQLMQFFLNKREKYKHVLYVLPTDIYPGILIAYCRLFEVALDGLENRFKRGGDQGLRRDDSEVVALLDRLGGYAITGQSKYLPTKVLRALGTLDQLRRGAWPYINPVVLHLGGGHHGAAVLNVAGGRWPVSERTGAPVLLHLCALRYHYGLRVASARESALRFEALGQGMFLSPTRANLFLEQVVRELWIPQTRAFMCLQLRRQLRQANRDIVNPSTDPADAITAWETAIHPFTVAEHTRLKRALDVIGESTLLRALGGKARRDWTKKIVRALQKSNRSVKDRVVGTSGNCGTSGYRSIAPQHATWPVVFAQALAFAETMPAPASTSMGSRSSGSTSRNGQTDVDSSGFDWPGLLSGCLVRARVEWVPSVEKGRLTTRSCDQLRGNDDAEEEIPRGMLGTLVRRAYDARIEGHRATKRRALEARRIRVIDFDCEFPFVCVPDLVDKGLDEARLTFKDDLSNQRVLAHYEEAVACLCRHIDDVPCQLLLMLALTVAVSYDTPAVVKGTKVGPKGAFTFVFDTKDAKKTITSHKTALCLVTRMLWKLYPQDFKEKPSSGAPPPDTAALEISEMTKKIGELVIMSARSGSPLLRMAANHIMAEHIGVNNQWIHAIGWGVNTSRRMYPRTSDVVVVSLQQMRERHQRLLDLVRRPNDFIAEVFGSPHSDWVDRCRDFIKDV